MRKIRDAHRYAWRGFRFVRICGIWGDRSLRRAVQKYRYDLFVWRRLNG